MQSVSWLSANSPNKVACAEDLTGHLNAPGESVKAVISCGVPITGRRHRTVSPPD